MLVFLELSTFVVLVFMAPFGRKGLRSQLSFVIMLTFRIQVITSYLSTSYILVRHVHTKMLYDMNNDN